MKCVEWGNERALVCLQLGEPAALAVDGEGRERRVVLTVLVVCGCLIG